jgi:hypothetical protein
MTSAESTRRRRCGSIVWLPSGSARVKVYAGIDPVTGEDVWLRETVRKGRRTKRETERDADKALTKLLNQLDERRNPRTGATVNQLVDRWLDIVELERTTRAGYLGKIEKHIRPTIRELPVARLDAEAVDSLYARLRRCRDHCKVDRSSRTGPMASTYATSTAIGASAPRSCATIPPPTASGATVRAAHTCVSHSRRPAFALCMRS